MAERLHKSFSGKGVYPAERSGWLLNPLRRLIMPPDRMVRALRLRPVDHVLEIGPGPGWFSPSLARAIPQGRLMLFDIQGEMLEMARSRLEAAGVTNFDVVEGDATHLPFPDGSFDLVFLATVLGEISDPAAALQDIVRVLKPQGSVSITEQFGDPDHVTRDALRHMAGLAGLEVQSINGSALLYTASLRKH